MRYGTAIVIVGAGLLALLSAAGSPPPADEDAAVRASLDAYLAMVAWPAPAAIEPALFAEGIEAYWSNGTNLRGRGAFAKAMKEGVREIAADFESFSAQARNVTIHRNGKLAWLTCQLKLGGVLPQERGEFGRNVRSTFIFEKHGDRWIFAHEHSSRPPERGE